MRLHRSRAEAILLLGTAAGALAGTLASLGHVAWWLELFSHFRPQYAVWLALCGIGLLALRRPALGIAALLLGLANALPLLHYYGETPIRPAPRGEALDAVLLNLFFYNGDHGRVVGYLQEAGPDLAVLLEVTPAWREALHAVAGELPYQAQAGDVLVASRLPLAGVRAVTLPSGEASAILLRVRAGESELTVIGTHANWPLGPRMSRNRNRELAALGTLARSVEGPLLVLGDLNVTAFSPVFRHLLSRGRLADCAAGRGWHPTWPSWFPPLYLQIDHCLASPGVAIAHFGTGPYVGSDHYPVEVSVQVEPGAATPAAGAVTAAARRPTSRR